MTPASNLEPEAAPRTCAFLAPTTPPLSRFLSSSPKHYNGNGTTNHPITPPPPHLLLIPSPPQDQDHNQTRTQSPHHLTAHHNSNTHTPPTPTPHLPNPPSPLSLRPRPHLQTEGLRSLRHIPYPIRQSSVVEKQAKIAAHVAAQHPPQAAVVGRAGGAGESEGSHAGAADD